MLGEGHSSQGAIGMGLSLALITIVGIVSVAAAILLWVRFPWPLKLAALSAPIVLLAATSHAVRRANGTPFSGEEFGEAVLNHPTVLVVLAGIGLIMLLPSWVAARSSSGPGLPRLLTAGGITLWLAFLYLVVIHGTVWSWFDVCLPPGYEPMPGVCDLPPG